MVQSNEILYDKGEHPDHVVVIKYVPYVGDSKRAMDEYTSEIMMGGHNTLVLHNTCEDSLLAAPIILDLVILAELCSRIKVILMKTMFIHYIYCGPNIRYTLLINIPLSCFIDQARCTKRRISTIPIGAINSELLM